MKKPTMIVMLTPGTVLSVRTADANGEENDGEIFVEFTETNIRVLTDWPDSSGREGVLYDEDFSMPDPDIQEVRASEGGE